MADDWKIEIKNEKILAAFKNYPKQLGIYVARAGQEAAYEILKTPGLKSYPRDIPRAPQAQYWTEKQRKHFFWLLKRGDIEVPYRRGLSRKSERYGTQYYIDRDLTKLEIKIGNRASYAKYLAGDDSQQSKYMAARGWLQLYKTARSKENRIIMIYNAWINKLLKDLNLT